MHELEILYKQACTNYWEIIKIVSVAIGFFVTITIGLIGWWFKIRKRCSALLPLIILFVAASFSGKMIYQWRDVADRQIAEAKKCEAMFKKQWEIKESKLPDQQKKNMPLPLPFSALEVTREGIGKSFIVLPSWVAGFLSLILMTIYLKNIIKYLGPKTEERKK